MGTFTLLFFGAPRVSLVLSIRFLRIISLVLAAVILMLKFIVESIIPLLKFFNEFSSLVVCFVLVVTSMMSKMEGKTNLEHFHNVSSLKCQEIKIVFVILETFLEEKSQTLNIFLVISGKQYLLATLTRYNNVKSQQIIYSFMHFKAQTTFLNLKAACR